MIDQQTKSVLKRLISILAGETEVSEGSQFISPTVGVHMDRYHFQSYRAWYMWISFIRTKHRLSDLTLKLDRMVPNDDGTITMFGHWHGLYKGKAVVSDEVSARYRVENGTIVEIWTTRTNYVLLLGNIMKYEIGLSIVLLWLYLRNLSRQDQVLEPA